MRKVGEKKGYIKTREVEFHKYAHNQGCKSRRHAQMENMKRQGLEKNNVVIELYRKIGFTE